ncbi:amidohydrolase [Pontibacter harenae]|uniref:amidohydrolase n=1 Tax=Pontibacter harenae TaxID=2894083 RepID=UPI001E4AB057|nr:amidohydrolase [Pontibacter harenae]MCC9168251.1 amidohydrolase [Pontibacter harenae]
MLQDFQEIIQIRRHLHQHPELSGQEHQTAAFIVEQLAIYKPDYVLTGLGGSGVVAVFQGSTPEGPTVLFRAELDALPIAETNLQLAHISKTTGVGHTCGHDGHIAILLGMAQLICSNKFERGRVILLFQPAEETGAGADAVLQNNEFLQLKPDYVFALHNLPSYPTNQVVVRQGVFSAASTGLIIELEGKTSHAAEPENGLNPGDAMAELVLAVNNIAAEKAQFEDLTILTLVHARLGEVAFGTNPGFATVMATLRAYKTADFQLLKKLVQEKAASIAKSHQLKYSIQFVEEFPATVNDFNAVEEIKKAASQLAMKVVEAAQPFRWSEDFGHFTATYKGALFGLGAGVKQPQLHHSDYDFPDELIPAGSQLFYRIAQNILNS